MYKNILAVQQAPITDYSRTVIDIPVELIRPNPYQPRKKFNKIALEELCDSIRTYGLLQPITVRRMPGLSYELARTTSFGQSSAVARPDNTLLDDHPR